MKEIFETFLNSIMEVIKNYMGDWGESDPSSPSYIKNRTHWSEMKLARDVVLNETLPEVGDYAQLGTPFYANVNTIYYVTLNGVEYKCTPWRGSDGVYLGNGNVYGGEGKGELEYPFCIDSHLGAPNIAYLNITESGDYHITIEAEVMKEVVYKIDEKYLPYLSVYNDFDKIVESECLVVVDGEYMGYNGELGSYPSPKVNDRIVLTVGDMTFEGVVRPTDDRYHIVVGNGTLNERGDGVSNGEDFFIDFSAWGDDSIITLCFSDNANINRNAPVKILAYTENIKTHLLNNLVGKDDINFDSDGNLTITINGVTKKFAPIE